MEHVTPQGEESHELVVVRLYNGEIGEDIVELDEIVHDDRIMQTVPHDSAGPATAPLTPGSLARNVGNTAQH